MSSPGDTSSAIHEFLLEFVRVEDDRVELDDEFADSPVLTKEFAERSGELLGRFLVLRRRLHEFGMSAALLAEVRTLLDYEILTVGYLRDAAERGLPPQRRRAAGTDADIRRRVRRLADQANPSAKP
jgi:hypothetical protein